MSLPTSAGIVLRHGSHFLLIQRGKGAKNWPNYWWFPGGKVESWELPKEAAIRETREETGVSVKIENIVSEIDIHAYYIDGDKHAYLYLVDTWEGMPENLESEIHTWLEWYSIDEFPTPIIPHLLAGFHALLSWEKTLEYMA